MANRQAAPVYLNVSLCILAAVTVVTAPAVVSWSHGIEERLTSTAPTADMPSDTVIGGVEGAEAWAYAATPAPLPMLRPASERLPSQMPQPSTVDYAYVEDSYPDADTSPASLTDSAPMTVDDSLPADPTQTASEEVDPIAIQAMILQDMRQAQVVRAARSEVSLDEINEPPAITAADAG